MANLKHFYVGVKGVIYNPDTRKVLVLSKTDQTGRKYYDIPGGRIDDTETIEETLKRELSEEVINLEESFEIGKLLNAYRLSRDLNDGLGLLLLFYKIESSISEIQISDEHESYKWVSREELDDLTKHKGIYIEDGYLKALKLALE